MSDSLSKRLNEMDDLRDMGRFPVPVHAGATANVLLTILLTFLLRGRRGGPLTLPMWAGGVIELWREIGFEPSSSRHDTHQT